MILNILNSNSNERIEQYRTISPISFSKLSFKQLINVFCLKQHQIHIIFLKGRLPFRFMCPNPPPMILNTLTVCPVLKMLL